ncbi:MAG: N-acetylmuramoyl-L-alanine amidase [Solirubrobacteraceae bacterium]
MAGAGVLAGAGAGPAAGRASASSTATAAAAQERGAGRLSTVVVGDLAGVSAAIERPGGFVLAGAQWSGPRAARIELRARGRGGRWSRWATASVAGHEPDRPAGPGDERFGEPLWFGPSDALQARAPEPVRGLCLHLVAADHGPVAATERAAARPRLTPVPYPLAQPVLAAGPGQPPIIARSAWAGNHHGPAGGPYYGAVRLAFVHHTESPNGYSVDEVPALILAIYDYHRYARGYFDIAYNFVLDSFGRIWEARAGGIDEPVIGAHAGGYNAVSTGIAVIGTFMYALPPPAALDALQRLLAWKLALHGVPSGGRVQVRVNPSDAFYTPFRPGQLVRLPRIAGHRDGDMTDCPGDDLYHRLPSIRARVGALAGPPPRLTLVASAATVPPAAPVTLSGALTDGSGAPVAGAGLQVQTVAGIGSTTTVATVTTATDGTWTATITPVTSVVVRALSAVAPAVAVSDLVLVGLIPTLTLTLTSASPLRVGGTIVPAKRRVMLSVYRVARGRRHLVATREVSARTGSFSARLSLGRRPRGSYVIVARSPLDALTDASASAPLTVTL